MISTFYYMAVCFIQLVTNICVQHGCINPLTAKLFNLNFHSLEVVSR